MEEIPKKITVVTELRAPEARPTPKPKIEVPTAGSGAESKNRPIIGDFLGRPLGGKYLRPDIDYGDLKVGS